MTLESGGKLTCDGCWIPLCGGCRCTWDLCWVFLVSGGMLTCDGCHILLCRGRMFSLLTGVIGGNVISI